MSIERWMDKEDVMLSYMHIYIQWNTIFLCTLPRGEGVGEVRIGSLGVADTNYYNRLNNNVRLYSAGIQNTVINSNGKEYEK